jgi:uncharacterized protein YidB (DUF937 family)
MEANMGLFDDAVPGGNIAKPLVIALGALLVGKMLSGKSSQPTPQAPQEPEPADTTAEADGGLLGGLGGLLDKLKEAGHGTAADSWVGTGENKPIAANDLGKALGAQTIKMIAERTGISEDELLKQLSTALPGLVDKLTPGGQVPSQEQVASAWRK